MFFRAQREVWSDCVKLYVLDRANKTAVVTNLTLQTIEEGDALPYDTPFRLNEAQAQELMDQLWLTGLRPTEGSGSAGALAATQRHLEDMRSLVFKKN